MMNEQSQSDNQSSKRKKHIVLLVLGLFMTVIADRFLHGFPNPNAYTAGALAFIFLSKPIIYFIILSLIALVVAAIRKSVKQFWFPTLAWLFLVAGAIDIIGVVIIWIVIASLRRN